MFDRIEFEQVSEDELEELRHAMQQGEYQVVIDEGTFAMAEYSRFLDEIREEAASFKERQSAAVIDATVGY